MTRTRILPAKSPTDLLAMVPCLLGFHPEDSLVLLTLGDGRDRFHARVDLPRDADEVATVVDSLMLPVERHGVRRVVVVVYSDDTVRADLAFGPLRAALEHAEVTVAEAIRADGRRWFSLTPCGGPCCPAAGTPYDVSSHPFTAQSVLEGQVTLASRGELAETLVGSDPDARATVDRAARRWTARTRAAARQARGRPQPERRRAYLLLEGRWVADRVRRYLADGDRLDAEDAGRLLVAIRDTAVRDVAWSEMTRGNAGRHVDLWRDLVRRSPQRLAAAPAGLLGFAAWLSGDGALAWCAVECCERASPDYRMAALLTQALTLAVPPSSWTPVSREQLPLFAE